LLFFWLSGGTSLLAGPVAQHGLLQRISSSTNSHSQWTLIHYMLSALLS